MKKEFKPCSDNVFVNKKIVFSPKEAYINSEFETFFCTNLTAFDLAADPDLLVKALSNLQMIHSRDNGGCGKKIHIMFGKQEYRFWCEGTERNCGTIIVFPPRPDRQNKLLVKFIPAKKFDSGKNGL